MQESWAATVAKMLDKADAESLKDLTYRENYRDAVEYGRKQGGLTDSAAGVITGLPGDITRWSAEGTQSPDTVLSEWLDRYLHGELEWPSEILDALAKRLPDWVGREVDWAPHILAIRRRAAIDALYHRGFIRKADLVEVAKEHPARFYASPALDVLVGTRTRVPQEVWAALLEGTARPTDLMSGPDALVAALDGDSASTTYRWLAESFVYSGDDVREALTRAVLTDASVVSRLVLTVVLDRLAARSEEKRATLDDVTGVALIALVTAATTAAAEAGPSDRHWHLLTLLTGLGSWCEEALADPVRDALNALNEEHGAERVLASLREREDSSSNSSSDAILVQASSLYETVQRYLEGLPGGGGEAVGPERATRNAEIKGRLAVVRELIDSLDDLGASPEAEAIEIALYNVGVREFGALGETLEFDPARHRCDLSVVPGDDVVIRRSGRRLGDDPDLAIIIERAVVEQVD